MLHRFLAAPLILTLASLPGPAAGQSPDPREFGITLEKHHVDFKVQGKLIARYVTEGEKLAKPYFYPLVAPNGGIVTRGWPMDDSDPKELKDHVHQKSAWFCHGDVIPEGLEIKDKIKGVKGVDFWSEHKGHGRIVCTSRDVKKAKDRVSLITQNEWRTADGVKILDETRTIHLSQVPAGWLLTFEIDLHASVYPITFGDTKEGCLGVRVPWTMTESKGKGKLTNAEGKSGMKAIWGHASPWCDYSGPVRVMGQPETTVVAGVAILDHPSNPVKAYWHSRDYGLMAANPFGRKAFPGVPKDASVVKLARGEHLKLRYGLLLHSGDVKDGKVAETAEKFFKSKE